MCLCKFHKNIFCDLVVVAQQRVRTLTENLQGHRHIMTKDTFPLFVTAKLPNYRAMKSSDQMKRPIKPRDNYQISL